MGRLLHGMPSSQIQEEAHAIYSTLLEWTTMHSSWIVGGDLNETRSAIDRERLRELKIKTHKFLNNFLEDAGGIDVWRSLFPLLPGFTYRNSKGTSFSRLDYFLISPPIMDQ